MKGNTSVTPSSDGTFGPGGLSNINRNPNTPPSLNGAPEGPMSHQMGYTGDSGMSGSTDVKGKNGETFSFK